MNWDELEEGMRVVAHVTGTVQRISNGITLRRDDGDANFFRASSGAIYDPALPPFAPVQEGDIWEADGIEYIVEVISIGFRCVQPINRSPSMRGNIYAYCDNQGYSKNLDDFYQLNPKLIRRRGE